MLGSLFLLQMCTGSVLMCSFKIFNLILFLRREVTGTYLKVCLAGSNLPVSIKRSEMHALDPY